MASELKTDTRRTELIERVHRLQEETNTPYTGDQRMEEVSDRALELYADMLEEKKGYSIQSDDIVDIPRTRTQLLEDIRTIWENKGIEYTGPPIDEYTDSELNDYLDALIVGDRRRPPSFKSYPKKTDLRTLRTQIPKRKKTTVTSTRVPKPAQYIFDNANRLITSTKGREQERKKEEEIHSIMKQIKNGSIEEDKEFTDKAYKDWLSYTNEVDNDESKYIWDGYSYKNKQGIYFLSSDIIPHEIREYFALLDSNKLTLDFINNYYDTSPSIYRYFVDWYNTTEVKNRLKKLEQKRSDIELKKINLEEALDDEKKNDEEEGERSIIKDNLISNLVELTGKDERDFETFNIEELRILLEKEKIKVKIGKTDLDLDSLTLPELRQVASRKIRGEDISSFQPAGPIKSILSTQSLNLLDSRNTRRKELQLLSNDRIKSIATERKIPITITRNISGVSRIINISKGNLIEIILSQEFGSIVDAGNRLRLIKELSEYKDNDGSPYESFSTEQLQKIESEYRDELLKKLRRKGKITKFLGNLSLSQLRDTLDQPESYFVSKPGRLSQALSISNQQKVRIVLDSKVSQDSIKVAKEYLSSELRKLNVGLPDYMPDSDYIAEAIEDWFLPIVNTNRIFFERIADFTVYLNVVDFKSNKTFFQQNIEKGYYTAKILPSLTREQKYREVFAGEQKGIDVSEVEQKIEANKQKIVQYLAEKVLHEQDGTAKRKINIDLRYYSDDIKENLEKCSNWDRLEAGTSESELIFYTKEDGETLCLVLSKLLERFAEGNYQNPENEDEKLSDAFIDEISDIYAKKIQQLGMPTLAEMKRAGDAERDLERVEPQPIRIQDPAVGFWKYVENTISKLENELNVQEQDRDIVEIEEGDPSEDGGPSIEVEVEQPTRIATIQKRENTFEEKKGIPDFEVRCAYCDEILSKEKRNRFKTILPDKNESKILQFCDTNCLENKDFDGSPFKQVGSINQDEAKASALSAQISSPIPPASLDDIKSNIEKDDEEAENKSSAASSVASSSAASSVASSVASSSVASVPVSLVAPPSSIASSVESDPSLKPTLSSSTSSSASLSASVPSSSTAVSAAPDKLNIKTPPSSSASSASYNVLGLPDSSSSGVVHSILPSSSDESDSGSEISFSDSDDEK